MEAPTYAEPIVMGVRIGLVILLASIGLISVARHHPCVRWSASVGVGVILLWPVLVILAVGSPSYQPLWLALLILVPVITAIALTRLPATRTLVSALGQRWLVGLQVFRAVGGIFIVLWLDHRLPTEFAVPVGAGDVFVGLMALGIFVALAINRSPPSWLLVLWNLLGLADHVMALVLGLITSPGPLQRLAFDEPNVLMGTYPMAMIPAFIIPLSFVLHGLSLWQLRQDSKRA